MLPTTGHEARFVGRLGRELGVDEARSAARAAALNVLAVARKLGDDKVSTRLVVGVASLPLGVPVELEVIFEVTP
jgi:enamine deaminase RidA (YjgF/YER057c/UK114 family)